MWERKYFPFDIPFSDRSDFSQIAVNEQCFIRKGHKCGKLKGASKSCFIACPNDDDLNPIFELITEKLAKYGIEAIIAVKERAYGQDIFCTKICGKIIESKFCIVILDDKITNNTLIPNPNVYYEYGFMTALRKHIIPLQKENLKLAFNIQSHDTIKYTPKNIGMELDRAIRDAIKITEGSKLEEKKIELSEKALLRNLELKGIEEAPDRWFLHEAISDTQFKGFIHTREKSYVYIAKIDSENDITAITEDLNVLLYRTEKEYNILTEKNKDHQNKINYLKKKVIDEPLYSSRYNYQISDQEEKIQENNSKIELMNLFFIAFILKPNLNIGDLINTLTDLMQKYPKYKLCYNTDGELKIGETVITLQ
ncbi:MAG: hypothetical protein V1859_08175 [archaeon]